jgi:hypothetical protein
MNRRQALAGVTLFLLVTISVARTRATDGFGVRHSSAENSESHRLEQI